MDEKKTKKSVGVKSSAMLIYVVKEGIIKAVAVVNIKAVAYSHL